MPFSEFKIIGEVTAEDGSPIEGIKVKYSRLEYVDDNGVNQYYENDENEFLTNKEGKVNSKIFDYTSQPQDITITLEDIDGEANGGLFETMVLHNEDLQIEFIKDNDDRWHIGDYTINFAAKMKQAAAKE